MSCPTCKESILNQTKSLILETKCNQPCPQDITCEDIIPSNCVFYSGPNLSCPSGSVTVNYGDTITVALDKMFQLICQSTDSNTVAITSADTCPGYLASKITSSSLAITVTNPGGCEKLNIEEGCFTWNAVLTPGSGDGRFLSGFSNAGGPFEIAHYSNAKGCSVRLKGVVSKKFTNTCIAGQTIFVLPTGKRPSKSRIFSINMIRTIYAGCSTYIPASIFIDFNGNINIFTNIIDTNSTYLIPLDGIEFETN